MIGFLRRRPVLLALPLALLVIALWQMRVQPPAAQAFPTFPGWNLVANPLGTLRNPAYTFQLGDTAYETTAPGDTLVPGLGYWVYSPNPSAFPLGAGTTRAVIQAPPGQYVMIGDPSGILPAQVTGADALLSYDPRSGYVQLSAPVLLPGQAAFAISNAGGAILITTYGTSTLSCSIYDVGSACPVNGACPIGYPVAVTKDAFAHTAPAPGLPPVGGPVALCFNDISQAIAAGYEVTPDPRVVLFGPSYTITSDIRVTVSRALLETPAAYMARVLASGDQLCPGCDISGATAIVTVEYGIENLFRPPTLVSTGSFLSARSPQERSFAYLMLASQHTVDPAHLGVPLSGSISGVFTRTKFSDVDKIDWRLDSPFVDASFGNPQPHGPNMVFELNFRGSLAGQVVARGTGTVPQQPFEINYNPYAAVVAAGIAGATGSLGSGATAPPPATAGAAVPAGAAAPPGGLVTPGGATGGAAQNPFGISAGAAAPSLPFVAPAPAPSPTPTPVPAPAGSP